MQAEITAIQGRLGKLEDTQAANHRDNRKDIHELRNELQKLVLTLPQAIREGLDGLGDKVARQIAEAITPLQHRTGKAEDKIQELELKWARASGYAAAGAVGAGLLFEAAKVTLGHFLR